MSTVTTTPTLPWSSQPLRELLRLAWPNVISLLSLSLMTFIDTLFMGWLGTRELGAGGLGGVAVFTVVSFGLSVLGAAKVKVGEHHGQGARVSIERALGAFLRLAIWLGFISVVLGLLVAAVLPHLSADRGTGQMAGHYAAIRTLGFPIALIGHAIGQWRQAQGDSHSAMRAALWANVANAPLNALFIFGLGWGVAGAAAATAASRLVETSYLLHLQGKTSSILSEHDSIQKGFFWNSSTWQDSYRAFRVGLPSGLERLLDMMAFTAVPLLLSQVGPAHVAAHQIVLQVMLLSFLPLIALSDSISVLISQAVGAKASPLIRRLHQLGLALAVAYGLLCALVFILLATPFVSLFSRELSLRELAEQTLVVGAVLQLINAVYNHYKGVLRGLSEFRFVAWVTVGCAWLITPPLTYLWAVRNSQGAPGAWLVLCLEVTLGVFLCWWRAVQRTPAP